MNLENLNLVELNAQEVQEIDGGIWGVILGAIATACIADWDNFERGLRGLPCKD
ncbi:class IIb bacteriocin, lactobin A/cerein 7B family [Flavobacterium sp. T12S277]|uniref:class IIb bacteriocin, lactobin A/cerein 7B family n=1 Tax=Flavobacterium sp. T12S277 TaxID=3402752 RepID=UPI003AE477C5